MLKTLQFVSSLGIISIKALKSCVDTSHGQITYLKGKHIQNCKIIFALKAECRSSISEDLLRESLT